MEVTDMTDIMDNSQETNTEVSGTGEKTQTQEGSKTFTQDELNAIVAKRVAQAQKKFDGVDIEEYNQLRQAREAQEQEQLLKRQEFDKVLKQTAEKKDSEIQKLRNELTTVRVDGALVNAASKLKATNPEHVARLLRENVRLDDGGQPLVLDEKGEARYNTDTGEPYTIDSLVEEFINSNPYFKSAGRPGTSSESNTQSRVEQEFDLQTLAKQMVSDPKARELYKKMMRDGLV